MADGPKAAVLTEQHLALAYDANIRVTRVGGYYAAWPGDDEVSE